MQSVGKIALPTVLLQHFPPDTNTWLPSRTDLAQTFVHGSAFPILTHRSIRDSLPEPEPCRSGQARGRFSHVGSEDSNGWMSRRAFALGSHELLDLANSSSRRDSVTRTAANPHCLFICCPLAISFDASSPFSPVQPCFTWCGFMVIIIAAGTSER
jgi:hypothetical protein